MHDHIAAENEAAARTFTADLSAKIAWIAETGFSGVPRDWIREGLRALPYRDRCIYFRIDDRNVRIVRVLHSKQDVRQQAF